MRITVRLALALGVLALVAACGARSSGHRATPAAHVARPVSTGVATRPPRAGSRAAATPTGLVDVPLTVASGLAGAGPGAARTVRVPRGWHAEVWARVPGARLEAWTPEGDLLVSQPASGQVTELVPRDDRSAAPAERVLVSGLSAPQGLAFGRLGGRPVLYVAEDDAVERYAWRDGRLGAGRAIVRGLPDTAPAGSDNHTLKNVIVAPGGRIDVDIGSGSNASPPVRTDPPRAAVVSYSSAGTDMRVIATGVRNGDGLSYAPDGTLWAAVNERDQIAYPFHRPYAGAADADGQVIPAYVDEHPPDELARLNAGRDLGWPYCDPDPDPPPGTRASSPRYGDIPFTDDQQTNPGGARLDCARLAPLERGIPAHSAPLGFHFLEGSQLPPRWRDGAILAVHGSWDRQPPRPPGVLWLPWDARSRTLGAPITVMSGFQDADGTRWGRPADALAGPDGALYVSDDDAGAIYRLVP